MKTRQFLAIGVALLMSMPAGAAPPPPSIEPDTDGVAGNVRVGPVLKLLERPGHIIGAAPGADGRLHLISYSREEQKDATVLNLADIIVGADGAIAVERIVDIPKAEEAMNFAVASDHAGNVRLVVGDNHYTRTAAGWSMPVKGPPCGWLLYSGTRFVCAMVVSGVEVGAPHRWRWHLAGGGLGAIAFPWRENSKKLVLTQEADGDWSDWWVVDPDTKSDAAQVNLAGDDAGVVHVLYVPTLAGPLFPRYARVDMRDAGERAKTVAASTGSATTARVATAISGLDVRISQTLSEKIALGVDQASGNVLGIARGVVPGLGFHEAMKQGPHWFTVINGQASAPSAIEAFAKASRGGAYIAAVGHDRFHVVLALQTGQRSSALYYMTYGDGNWSDPVLLRSNAGGEVSILGTGLFMGGSGRAFLTWIDKTDSIPRGRWISLAE